VLDHVDQWCKHAKTLSAVTASQPQAAFSADTKSLQFEWTFIMRVTRDCGPLFSELENCLSSFIPALFGVEVSLAERRLFSLPLRVVAKDPIPLITCVTIMLPVPKQEY